MFVHRETTCGDYKTAAKSFHQNRVSMQDEEPQGKKRRRGAALDDDAEDDSDFDDLREAKATAKEGARSVRHAATEGAQTRGGRSAAKTVGGRSLGAKTTATARGNASQHSGDRSVPASIGLHAVPAAYARLPCGLSVGQKLLDLVSLLSVSLVCLCF